MVFELEPGYGRRQGALHRHQIQLSRYVFSDDRPRGCQAPHLSRDQKRQDGRQPGAFSILEWEKRLKDSARSIIASQQLQNPMADEAATFQAR